MEQNITKITTIENIIKQFITKNKTLQNIIMDVEITELRNYNGMCFLKVTDGTATIKAVIYRNVYILEIKPGDKINIDANLSVYHMDLQLNINSYSHVGDGDKNIKLALLKKRLEKLGYFSNKPKILDDYNCIGVVSSLNAAGLKDFIFTINTRCQNKKIFIYPSSVQGQQAPVEISNAINLANRHKQAEILVLIRGGGSKEDLECFNSESLALNIHQSTIPLVTGIGHQIDTSIADMAAAKSFITPTSAAQNITRENIISKMALYQLLDSINSKIVRSFSLRYEYLTASENKIIKYHDQLLSDLDKNTSIFHDKQKSINYRIKSSINQYYGYLINSQIALYETWTYYYNNITKQASFYHQHYDAGIEICDKIIKIYDTAVNNIVKPTVTHRKSGKEINCLADLIAGKEYIIKFIDGEYIIKT